MLHISSFSRTTVFIICLFTNKICPAEENDVYWIAKGQLEDFVTKQPITDGKTMEEVLHRDSTSLGHVTFATYKAYLRPPKTPTSCEVEKPGHYIFKLDNPFYETVYIPFYADSLSKTREIDLGTIYMKRKNVNVLDEVEVTASKLKFYFNHDTLVYNANVFMTQHGMVLNEILQKMPGVVIKENGEIEANGRRVDALLLNGKDFFNDDRKTLLNNLPAFMVKNVKVYDKSKDSTSLIKREREFEGYVMDVKLKKDYHDVFLANAELGYGTDGRYYAKLFGMRFNQISRLTFYAMANNVNQEEEMQAYGMPRKTTTHNGEKAWSKVGGSYLYEQPQGKYYLNGNAIIEYTDNDWKNNYISNIIYNDEKIYSRSLSQINNYEIKAQTNHKLYFLGNTKWDFTLWPSLQYTKTKGNGNNIRSSLNHDIDDLWGEAWKDSLRSRELTQALSLYGISRSESESRYNSHALRAQLSLDKDIKIPHSDNPIRIHANYQYHQTGSDGYGQSNFNQIIQKQNTFQNEYYDKSSNDDKEEVTINYGHSVGKNLFNIKYSYNRNALHNSDSRYALHELAGWDTQTDGAALGLLPSEEELLNALDAGNSYSYDQQENLHNIEMKYSISQENDGKRNEFSVAVPLLMERKELKFYQQDNDTLIRRNKCKPDLDVRYSFQHRNSHNSGTSWGLAYSINNSMPTLYNLVNFRNDANPFYISNGNPNLKDMTTQRWSGDFGYQNDKGYTENARASFYTTHNRQSRFIKYDAETGITETTPQNINGNWTISLDLNNTLFVSKNRMSSINNEMNYYVNNSVDYAYADFSSSNEKRTVLNFQVTEKIAFRWRSDNTKIHAGGNAYVTYRKSTSEWEDFHTLEMFDYGVQADIDFELPKSWRLKSDILTVCRSGYSTMNMNDQEYIWSASLKKAIGERYSFSLEGYDLLNQRKNVYHYVNAQGSSSTFHNNLRRYVMLRFTIRFNKGEQHHGHTH